MGCNSCKSECGREDGCGARKAAQKQILDGLLLRLYPSRRFGEADPAACFRAGLGEREVRRHGRALSVVLKAPTYYREGGPDDPCHFLYALCFGREPSLLEVRDAGMGVLMEQGDVVGEGRGVLRERYLRVACSTLGRLAAVQEVALELDLDREGGLGVVREVPQPGVFDPKLLKRFQKTVDYLQASDIEHLDMGLLDLPAGQWGLEPGDYESQYGTGPSLYNFLFQAQPVQTASAMYLPLDGPARGAGQSLLM